MRRRKRRSRLPPTEEVELNLTAMLDMAFQLLAFFVASFSQGHPPVEGQIDLNLPPPQAVARVQTAAAGGDGGTANPLAGLDTLTISVFSNVQGEIRDIGLSGPGALEPLPMGNDPRQKLAATLQEMMGSDATPFEQLIVQVDEQLRYQSLMRVVEVCTRLRPADGKQSLRLSLVKLTTEHSQ